ncbi:MAG: tetratricopeptide repeat protein [Candidatus Krumholzibacteriia bacterium]
MDRNVLISSGSGNANPADEALLAGAVRLLERGGRTPIVGLSADCRESARSHPQLRFVSTDEVDAALETSSVLVVVGDLRDAAALERAAAHVARAKLAGVPVAGVALRLPAPRGFAPATALLELLAQCESVSACDGGSSQLLSGLRGRRVETAAPLELLLAGPSHDAGRPETIGVCEELLASSSAAALEAWRGALGTVAKEWPARVVVVATRDLNTVGRIDAFERRVATTWPEWLRAVCACDLFVGDADTITLHVGAANGVVPVAWVQPRQGSDLHSRIGLPELVVPHRADARAIVRTLERARCATLRVVAWRALGPLSEATRSRPFEMHKIQGTARALIAQALAERLRALLESGDVVTADAQLEDWRVHLEREPRWAEMRARAWVLLGRDHEAQAMLERALAQDPHDTECHAALAMVLWRLGDVAGAEETWQRLSALEPHSARAPYQIGCLELVRGRVERALQAWSEAQTREPGHQPSAEAVQRCLATQAGHRVV